MLYRLFQPGDFAQLYAIEEVCFQPPLRFSRAYLHRLTASRRTFTWIAEEESRMSGFAIISIKPETHAAYIQTLEVLPEMRGRGIGAELLNRLESSAITAGAQSIGLHVDAENSAAIRLYESRGYEQRGREENYYAHSRAALIYSKSLNTEQ